MKKAEELFEKYNSGKATPEERAIVEDWYLKYKTTPSDLKPEELLEEYKIGLEKLQESIKEKKTTKLLPRIAVAASLLFFVAIAFYFFNSGEKQIRKEQLVSDNSVVDTNAIVLTLANGRKINITDNNVGAVAEEEGLKIDQAADGMLVYTILDKARAESENSYNTIETPIGNQYAVVLPDGSKIWLSSASKLRYPIHFSEKERKVELTGEAFFEVKSVYSSIQGKNQPHSQKIPFIVQSGNQEVEVLGTQFNVSAYQDEEVIKTALLEGAVKVSLKGTSKKEGVVLKPGQMALNTVNKSDIAITDVDVNDIKAWKEGYFIFNNENIKDIMKKLSRWYGFEVEYQGDMSAIEFQGNYLRTRDLTNLLKTMEMTDKVKFKIIEGIHNKRKVLVVRTH